MRKRVLVTGGAGFVGSSLAVRVKAHSPDWEITALDNLKRRGSELCIPRLLKAGVGFVHGDVRVAEDLDNAGKIDLILECSAEPSVLAGLDSSPSYVIQTNLDGTINCLELARRHRADMIFLSTSRVYPIGPLSRLTYLETPTRFELDPGPNPPPGLSRSGIAEDFTLDGARSIYGATKLCSELLIQEYAEAFGINAVINRCGVITGPWQMGKVDQGVVVHWIASHVFGRPLTYIGYGGTGKQVRDILHIDDLGRLVDIQILRIEKLRGAVFNIGGGRSCSVSLKELTDLCVQATGTAVQMNCEPTTRKADIPIYLTDTRKAKSELSWEPSATPQSIVEETTRWVVDHQKELETTLGL